ncbi:MAG: glutamyl-tRNA reductase, partial [Akkermansiaceae bacterium]
VPRDIEHSVGEIEEVYLYDIDALEQLAEEAKVRRVNQIVECEKIIEEELEKLGLTFTSSQ